MASRSTRRYVQSRCTTILLMDNRNYPSWTITSCRRREPVTSTIFGRYDTSLSIAHKHAELQLRARLVRPESALV